MKTHSTFRCAVLSAMLLVTFQVISQPTNNKLNKLITIKSNEIAIESLLQTIVKNTGMQFSYNPGNLKNVQKLRITKHTLRAAEWLSLVKEAARLDYKIIGDHIIVSHIKKHSSSPTLKSEFTRKPQAKATQMNLHASAIADVEEQGTSRKSIAIATANDTGISTLSSDKRNVVDTLQRSSSAYATTLSRDSANDITSNINAVSESKMITGNNAQASLDNDRSIREKNRGAVHNLVRLEFSPQGFGVGIDRRLSHNFLIDVSAGIGGSYLITDRLKYKPSVHDLGVYVSLNPKWYYNGVTQDIPGNEGFYFGSKLKYVHNVTMRDFARSVFLFNVHWGVQKRLYNRFFINAHVGPGLATPAVRSPYSSTVFYPSIDLKLSYLLKSSRKFTAINRL